MKSKFVYDDYKKALELASAARIKKHEEWSKLTLRQDFLDLPHWREMASVLKVRLPPLKEPCTLKRMRAYVRRVGIDHKALAELESFMQLNKDWPLYAFVGLLLEERTYNETN